MAPSTLIDVACKKAANVAAYAEAKSGNTKCIELMEWEKVNGGWYDALWILRQG
jgi:hypothetical protein